MITFFDKIKRPDLIDKLQHVVKLKWYSGYLKKQYKEVFFSSQVSVNKWLPSPTQRIFNLAIIRKERVQRGRIDNEFVHKTIRGQVDDILLQKSPIALKDIFRNIEGERKVILIDGAPGSGKSTLTIHICQQWGRGELFDEFSIVILVQLRDPGVQQAQSIADLLPCEDRAMAEQAATEILAIKGCSVLWILDGWDELPPHLSRESIFSKLICPKRQQNPLSKTTVIVTSRPISSGDLCPLVSSRIEVVGFTAEEQRRFFTECLNNDTKAVETLMERLSQNPAMEGSCYLPLNASIVAHLYLTDGSLPSTIYGIFSSLVQHCLSRYLHERQGLSPKLASFDSLDGIPDVLRSFFEQLCMLAFTGARDNKVTFSSSDIEALGGSPDEICELGLLQAVPSIVSHGRSVYHNFLHLSIQEMLAAVHISRMPASEQISTFDSMFNDARFSAVLQFYAAITKLRTSRRLLSLVPRFLRPVPASVYDLVRKIIRRRSKSLLVSLLNCLCEAQDTALCKYVGEQLREKRDGSCIELDLHGMSLLRQDFLSVGYFLASIAVSYKGKFTVNLNSCSLGDNGIKILMQSLCRSLDPYSEITGHLNLNIVSNEITGEGASYIAEALRTTRALRKLYPWHNSIGDKGLQYIADALTTNTSLIKLRLTRCSLRMTEENGPTIIEMLERNKTLRKLTLSYNEDLSSNAASFIIEGLKKNTTLKKLNLTRCNFTDDDIHLIQSSTSTCTIISYGQCRFDGDIQQEYDHILATSRNS